MPTNIKAYRDLDLDFDKHPVTGDIAAVANDIAVKRSIRNLLNYNFYEKPFNPEFGADLRGLLGEPSGMFTDSLLKDRIVHLIKTEEKRAQLHAVEIRDAPDANGVYASITFSVINFPDRITISVFLDRLR